MTGTTLAKVLTLLKSELRMSLTVGIADDALLKAQIETQQEWFASVYDWNVLNDKWDKTVTGRFTDLPTSDVNGFTHEINFDREVKVYTKFSNTWKEVGWGIGVAEMNVVDSDTGETQEPVLKWQVKNGDTSKFEVWPVGVDAQVMRFEGQRKVNTLRTAGVLDSALTVDLDDRLIAFSVAVGILTDKESPMAGVTKEKLNVIWQTLRGGESKQERTFRVGSEVGGVKRVVQRITVG